MGILFRRSKRLEVQIDEYLDLIVKGGLVFKEGVKFYLRHQHADFESHLEQLSDIEDQGDRLRREIETSLYSHTLIPESRGDVLGLLENADRVLNRMAETLMQFSVETPEVCEEFVSFFADLADFSITAAEGMVRAIRAYFTDLNSVRDYVNQVQFYRKETNKMAEKLKREVFSRQLRLSHKIHLRYFAYHVELIAEEAEDVCDRLAIATIKRYV
ncbi:MAG: DUF47 family protein [candidate division KSB1 bacterium]|nr:DUF47 family protein [candidate division KSB1 bacterium]MDZ7339417.1 DUF47 family protein [candidate division KSB1 bacterium]MDZ7385889.1 DUF47 family protein [candidate division KSB1 bacterium]MDZ7393031.1 DUF47 family protein [candidate division KSB1 bacterium]